MSKADVVNEIHKPARKNFARRYVVLKGIDDLWQADLIDLQNLKQYNNGYKFILVIIDCFSKFCWTAPIKNKSKSEVSEAFENILNTTQRTPLNLQTDMGKEFYNDRFRKIVNMNSINHYSTYSVKKASIVERLIQTLKNKLFKHFSISGCYKWSGYPLKKVVGTYNNTKHRVTKFAPVDVNRTNEHLVRMNIRKFHHTCKLKNKTKFKVGDIVRISKYKGCFEKGYTPNWSTELFVIRKINETLPVTYLIEDTHQQPVLGCFYEHELQNTKFPNTYLIEKVIKRKGNKLFVKWLGLPNTENSWINKEKIV